MKKAILWLASWENIPTKALLEKLPPAIQQEILTIKHQEEQNQALIAKTLTHKMLQSFGYDFHHLHYAPNQKPVIQPYREPLFFSYSKSVGKVALAWSQEIELGVDIEPANRKTDWKIFQSRLSPSVWQYVAESDEPLSRFLWSWTHIEAILKLKGLGLANQIRSVHYIHPHWYYQKEKIFTEHLVHQQHLITLASYEPFQPEIHTFHFE